MNFKGSQVCPRVASLTSEVDHKPGGTKLLQENLKAILNQNILVCMTVGQTHLGNFKFLLESETFSVGNTLENLPINLINCF